MKKILALVSFLIVAAACTMETTTNTNTNTPSNTNTTTTKSAAPVEADMIAFEKSAWETLKKKDYVAFGNLLASDYIEVNDGAVFDKAGIVADVKDFNLTDVTFSEWKMLPINNDAVILSYQATLKASYKGEDLPPGPYRAAAALVNRDGKWSALYFQMTRVNNAPPPPPPVAAATKPEKAAATPAAKPAEAGPDAIASEKIVWDNLKSKNYDAFAALLDPAFLELTATGVYDKAGSVKGVAEFDASLFELSEWKAVKIDADASLVTYLVKPKDPKWDQERHSTIWANRGGKWVALFHMGTPVAKPAPAKPEVKKM